jgi:hypothetical protein
MPPVTPMRTPASPPDHPVRGWSVIVLQIVAATIVSGTIAYFATRPERLAEVGIDALVPAVTAKVPVQPPPETVPVRFTNPFDTTEVFEFPAGTSEDDARQQIADLLLQRARDRQRSGLPMAGRQRKQATAQASPINSARLARAGRVGS